MKTFGFFDDKNREYVINDPATPFPWINYLGNEDFFGLISNTAGGYDFYKDAKFRRITRYRYNGVPMDAGGRYFYIKEESGKRKEERGKRKEALDQRSLATEGTQESVIWSPGWKPCKTPLDSYECRHGMNYTRITGSKNGVEASVLFFVPLKTWAEVQKLTLKNTCNEVKHLKLFSFTEWCLWNAATDMENFQRNWSTGEVEIENSGATIYHKTEYKERRNHYAYYALTNAQVNGYDTDRESFIGLYNDFSNPQCVMAGKPSNSLAHGWSPIASHYIEVELKPGESKDFIFVLGYVENEQEKKFESTPNPSSSFSTVEAVDAAFEELRQMWDGLLSKFTVESGDERLNRMVNIWNQYQCMITFCFSWDPNESFQTTENQSEGSKAERLMIAGLFVFTGKQYVELCRHLARSVGCDSVAIYQTEAERAQKCIDAMVEAVKRPAVAQGPAL